MAHHLHLLQLVGFTLCARCQQRNKFCKLDHVCVLVSLREAPLCRRHQMSNPGCQLYRVSLLILNGEHTLVPKDLHTLVIAVGGISATIDESHHSISIVCHDSHTIHIIHILDLRVVGMTVGHDTVRSCPLQNPVLDVKVMDQHILEDPTTCFEIWNGWQWIVAATRFDHLHPAHVSIFHLLLQGSEVAISPPLITAHKWKFFILGIIHCSLHFCHRMRYWLLSKD
mmetsp:Transcript_119963/g.208346  ORF Transcript_119963/g.208346 Transcript_119963/m.208346 type:complete len:226 (+) Transcript_119963:226-903(+)